jgi:hypothetical protein
VLNLEKKKEKNRTQMEIKAKVLLRVLVLVVKTIEGVITFRIDSHTIKRGILWLSGLLSATR